MRITYDSTADAAYVYLAQEGDAVARSSVCDIEIDNGAIIVQFDGSGYLTGIEILGASRVLRSSVLAEAEQLGM